MAAQIDRDAVRTLALAIGLTAAAQKLGLSEVRVRQWSSRYKWFPKDPKPNQLPSKTVTTVTKPSQALANALADDSKNTRIGLSKATLNASKTLSDMPGPKVLKHSRALVDVTKTAAVLHGWAVQPTGGTSIALNILTGSAAVHVQDTGTEPDVKEI